MYQQRTYGSGWTLALALFLALALALAHLSSRDIPIRSLFIDEGFGTLDAESLDMALVTLEQLQSEGRLVGIISHVEAIKERILCQIHIEPIGAGRSQLKVVHG